MTHYETLPEPTAAAHLAALAAGGPAVRFITGQTIHLTGSAFLP